MKSCYAGNGINSKKCLTRKQFIYQVLAGVGFVAFSGCTGKDQKQPNIVMIISDDQGWGDYGFMGHKVIKTPNLDRLALSSRVFTRGYVVAPLCGPSLASLITGLHPHQHGKTSNDPPQKGNGYEAPPMPGKSLVPLFNEDLQPEREIYFNHAGNKALRQGKWKAVISSDIDGRWQLYNMEEDRIELNNLADDFYNFGDPAWKQNHHERLEQMKARWEELDQLYQKQGKVALQ